MRSSFVVAMMLLVGSTTQGCGEDTQDAEPEPEHAPVAPRAPSRESEEPAPVQPAEQPVSGELDRTVLPIVPPAPPTYAQLDVRGVPIPPRFDVHAPADAPNVVVILLDDFGFGVSSTFGGPVATPTMDELAAQGLRYNNFHTTALCSPTRAALKSGRNHHMAGMGTITELATAFPGYTGEIPRRVASLAEMLRLNGYSTAALGKWHETAVWETSVSGNFEHWPIEQGFDYFYGFIGAEANQWAPTLFDGQTRIQPPEDPDYHFLVDMTDRAIHWVEAQQSLTPDKPFFLYYAPGATHAPHHVPKDWIARYHGKFDAGWDALRAETFARQKRLGIVPADTKLPDKPPGIKDWDTLSELEKRVFARQAEVYAAYAAMADHEAGRLIQAIDKIGDQANTMVIFIAGDNGASAEGGMVGLYNEATFFNGVPESLDELAKKLDDWGGPQTYPHMAAGWAIALDSPHKWTKQVASDFGGTRNAMIIRWPAGIQNSGELRNQFHHVIDVAPTVLEAAKLPEPVEVNGVEQIPIQGVSMLYSFADADADDRHLTQYFEILGNRAIYHDGWYARAVHRTPWETEPSHPLQADVWELYHVEQDFSLATDLSHEQPEKLAELQALFMREAEKNQVLPLDDRTIERFDSLTAGRPDLLAGRTSLTVYPGMIGMLENAFVNLKNASFTLTAVLDITDKKPHGTVLAQGGRFGGWSLHVENGRPAFTYNFLGLEQFTIVGTQGLPRGEVELRFEFASDGGRGAGGTGQLFVNDELAATGPIARTQGYVFSLEETADVGIDLATAVVESIGAGAASRFTGGEIEKITVDVDRREAARG
jgi:arylsulfatase A-like enzyme